MALTLGARKARMLRNQERFVRELHATCDTLAAQLCRDAAAG